MIDDVIKKLRNYQMEALDQLVDWKSGLEFDDMGLGKTLTTLCAVEVQEALPCIIICPKFALYVWKNELKKWFDKECYVYTGTPKQREKIWKEFVNSGEKYLVTNYAFVREIAEVSNPSLRATTPPGTPRWKWGAIIADEIHLGGLLNHKSKTYQAFDKFARDIRVKYLLTGTPIRQGCIDLYGPLHIIDPKRFNSYWNYVKRHCITFKEPFGLTIERNPRNIAQFREMLKSYMIRRMKSEKGVLDELPGKSRQCIDVMMDREQLKAYTQLQEDMYLETDDDIILTPNKMTQILRYRQILCCPQILGLKTRGAAMDMMLDMMKPLMEDNKAVVIFTPFRQAIPYILEGIEDKLGGVGIHVVKGGMTAAKLNEQVTTFQEKKGARVLICVIKSGASFQATAAHTAFFLGYEWSCQDNEQAEDRLNRQGQKNLVNIYYMMHRYTADEIVKRKLNDKQTTINWIISPEDQFKAMCRKVNKKGNKK